MAARVRVGVATTAAMIVMAATIPTRASALDNDIVLNPWVAAVDDPASSHFADTS